MRAQAFHLQMQRSLGASRRSQLARLQLAGLGPRPPQEHPLGAAEAGLPHGRSLPGVCRAPPAAPAPSGFSAQAQQERLWLRPALLHSPASSIWGLTSPEPGAIPHSVPCLLKRTRRPPLLHHEEVCSAAQAQAARGRGQGGRGGIHGFPKLMCNKPQLWLPIGGLVGEAGGC